MKGAGVFAVAIVVLVLVGPPAGADDTGRRAPATRGEDLYLERCSDCHGSSGEKRALGRSKVLKGLSRSEIIEKLRQYQKPRRLRGMKDKMKSGLNDDDIESLAAQIRLFERQ